MNQDRIRILLIEDDEDDYIMIRDLVGEIENTTYTIDWVSIYEDALNTLKESDHDIFLFDYRLGARTGLDLLNKVKEMNRVIPIIFLTGQGDHEIDMEAMRAGASDYLVKENINAILLERSIRYAIEHKRSELEREQLINDLRKALDEVKSLSGLLPMCSSCKKIRDDQGYWNQLETYLKIHSDAELSHGICPECAKNMYPEYYDVLDDDT